MKEPNDTLLRELLKAIDDAPPQNRKVSQHLLAGLLWALYPDWYAERVKEKEIVH